MRLREMETNMFGTKENLCLNHGREDREGSLQLLVQQWEHSYRKSRVQKISSRFRKDRLSLSPGRRHCKKVLKSTFPGSACAPSQMLSSINQGPRFLSRLHTKVASNPTWIRSSYTCQFSFFETATKKSPPIPFSKSSPIIICSEEYTSDSSLATQRMKLWLNWRITVSNFPLFYCRAKVLIVLI